MADIFISYARPDRPVAKSLADGLVGHFYSVWWDDNLVGSGDFRDNIEAELQAAKACIVIWSEHSIKSNFVRDEADYALQYGKLITVRVPHLQINDVPIGFRSLNADYVGDLEKLVQALKNMNFRPANLPYSEGEELRYYYDKGVEAAERLFPQKRPSPPLVSRTGKYTPEQLRQVAIEKSLRVMPEDEYLEDTKILKDLGVRRLAHRNAIIDEAGRLSMNIIELKNTRLESSKWFEDEPVKWLLGKVSVRPSTIWTFYYVAEVRDKHIGASLNDYGIFIQLGAGNFFFNWLNRRNVRRFERIFAPIMAAYEQSDLKGAWDEIAKKVRCPLATAAPAGGKRRGRCST